ncbi:hypothetical protein [Paenibacillus odorifer]|uniref:hypothetical protein n=1 Tax=Paenibacillus TaxID=44249 RepID=UPI000A5DB0FC|nr:hypothetical protein [Paenibacillus odorifer]
MEWHEVRMEWHEVRMEYVWSMYGVRMEYEWSTYGVRMVYVGCGVWNTYGVPIKYHRCVCEITAFYTPILYVKRTILLLSVFYATKN